jgi:hypothetical protein
VRNQPLKSMLHVSLASLQCASGAVRAACRTRLRRTDRPVRASKSPIVLAAGQQVPGWSSSSRRFNFLGPHVGLDRRSATTASRTHSLKACGIPCGAWLRSANPETPSERQRARTW